MNDYYTIIFIIIESGKNSANRNENKEKYIDLKNKDKMAKAV